jgi:hypothetical protein
MPQTCGWCQSQERTEWERAVASGTPVAVVAVETPFSESAARRHLRLHLRPELLSEMHGAGSPIKLTDFIARFIELIEEAARVRAYAVATNSPKIALQAIDTERATIVALMARLGIDSSEAAEFHNDAAGLARSVVKVILSGDYPGIENALASQLEESGQSTLANGLRSLATQQQVRK